MAGLGRRLAAAAYDLLLVLGLLVLGSAAVTLPVGLILGPEASKNLGNNPLFIGWLALIPAVFFIGFWLRGGQTLGMRAWRIRLISSDGAPITFRQAVIRYLSAILSWALLGLGFLWSLLDPERRTWHDRLSKTRLIVLEKKQPL